MLRTSFKHPLSGAFLVVLLLASPSMANAYVDPGSGAMIWQLGAAAVLGSILYVRRITAWFRARFDGSRKPDLKH